MAEPPKILDKRTLRERIPYSSMHISRLEQAGNFPKRFWVGPNRVGWLESEVNQWIVDRAATRDIDLAVAEHYDDETLDAEAGDESEEEEDEVEEAEV